MLPRASHPLKKRRISLSLADDYAVTIPRDHYESINY